MQDNHDRTEDAKQILEGISVVAAQRRRDVEVALRRPIPEWVLEIVQTEAVYTLAPRALPVAVMSFSTLYELLKEKYAVRFEVPDLGPIPAKSELPDADIGTALLRAGRKVRFVDGKFPRSPMDFVVISSINIDDESIHVVVQGISEVSELVTADVAEMLWAAAGAEKRWDHIKPAVQLIGYATSTLLDLGHPSESLLAGPLRDFVNTQMLGGERFAYEAGRRSARHGFEVSPSLTATWGLREVRLQISLFDSKTGRFEETKMVFAPMTRDSMGTGLVMVYSELPFQKHIECLGALRAAL